MESRGKVILEGWLEPLEEDVKAARRMLDDLEEERERVVRRVRESVSEASTGLHHTVNIARNVMTLIADQAIPPIADALLQSLFTIISTYQQTAAILATNPATAYLAIAMAAAATAIHLTTAAMAQFGMTEARNRLSAAAALFRQVGGLIV